MFVTVSLIAVFCLSGTLIGRYFYKRLSDKRIYFEQFVSLINTLSSEFKFRQTPVVEILNEKKVEFCPALIKTVEEFCEFVKNDKKNQPLKLSKQELTEREYSGVIKFFSELGRFDLETQLKLLENHKIKINDFFVACAEREKKFGGACVKLGFLCGLGVAVLLI